MRALEIFTQLNTILSEAEIPPTTYGYWIKDDGTIIPVGFEQHEQVIHDHGFSSGRAAIEAGWIRVIANARTYRLYVEVIPFRYSTAALSVLRRIAKDYDEFTVDADDNNKRFGQMSAFMGFMQSAVRRRS